MKKIKKRNEKKNEGRMAERGEGSKRKRLIAFIVLFILYRKKLVNM
jgi:hypothetical protein